MKQQECQNERYKRAIVAERTESKGDEIKME